jgi:hypothetical protein
MVLAFPTPTSTPSNGTYEMMSLTTSLPVSSCRISHRLANKLQRLVLVDSDGAARLESLVDKMLEYHALQRAWNTQRAE